MFLIFLISLFAYSFMLISLLISVAYLTLVERKVLGFIQRRESARWVGFNGVFQPFADAVKLVFKEFIMSYYFNTVFLFGPIFSFFLSLLFWLFLPINFPVVDLLFGIFIFYIISACSSFVIFLSGWSSNNVFSLLGLMRYISLVFSYELLFCLIILIVVCFTSTLNFNNIMKMQEFCWNIFSLFFPFLLCFIILLAETNRHPFDLGESESETVSGFFTEYSSMGFGLFFMGEYLNILTMSTFLSIVFLGGYFVFGINCIFFMPLKIILVSLLFIIIRGAYPRYRFDQVLNICWSSFFFFLFGFLYFAAGFEFVIAYFYAI